MNLEHLNNEELESFVKKTKTEQDEAFEEFYRECCKKAEGEVDKEINRLLQMVGEVEEALENFLQES
jgi:hypothetical protein